MKKGAMVTMTPFPKGGLRIRRVQRARVDPVPKL